MSRVIKFRAWDGKCMVTDELLVFWNGNTYLNESGTLNEPGEPQKPARLKGYTVLAVMQFTGLTDKNGKEIYEGDVLEYPKSGSRLPVVFRDGGFFVGGNVIGNLRMENHDLIGNIYENPELLES